MRTSFSKCHSNNTYVMFYDNDDDDDDDDDSDYDNDEYKITTRRRTLIEKSIKAPARS